MKKITEKGKFNCFVESWKYFIDKGIYLILITLVPSLLLSFLLSPTSTMYYLFTMDTVDASKLQNLFISMWDLPYSFWYIGFIGLVLLIPAVAISFGVIDRHMRIGEFTVSPKRIMNRLNFNLLTALKAVVVAFISLEFYNLLSTLLYFLWQNVIPNAVVAKVLCCISLCVMEIGMTLTMVRFILWPPYMLHTGMKSMPSFKAAWSSMSGKIRSAALTLFTVIAPLQIAMVITAAFDVGVVCRTVLDGVSYAIVIPFYLTVMYNLFYEVTGTERMDKIRKKESIWKK